MLYRNGKKIEQIFRNGREIALLYKNGVIIYGKRDDVGPVMKTFQDLIDEGYVTVGNSQPAGKAVTLTVSKNCPYSISQISDFYDVFNSIKLVSSNGVVGEGELPNAFLWPNEHWLTNAEVYELYNNTTLSHDPIGFQFRYLDWRDFDVVTIKYRDGSSQWEFTDRPIFGQYMPKTINFDINNRRISSMHWMFGRMPDNLSMGNTETLNFITGSGNSMQVRRNINGAFEGASSLKVITGLRLDSTDTTDSGMSDTFSGCTSLETIPIDLAPNGFHQIEFNNTFLSCSNLKEISPTIYASSITKNTNTFKNCSSLEVFYLNGINCIKNQNWDLNDTIINQDCANYIVTHLTEVSDFVERKNIYFPNTITLTNEQLGRLYDYGWNVYINGTCLTTNFGRYTLTYVSEIGDDIPDKQSFEYETIVTHNEPYSSEAYSFNSWNTSEDGSGITYHSGDKITNTTTLYAIWDYTEEPGDDQAIYVEYDANGGLNPPSAEDGINCITVSDKGEMYHEDGLEFLGWSTDSNGSVEYNPEDQICQNAYLYAVWDNTNN